MIAHYTEKDIFNAIISDAFLSNATGLHPEPRISTKPPPPSATEPRLLAHYLLRFSAAYHDIIQAF